MRRILERQDRALSGLSPKAAPRTGGTANPGAVSSLPMGKPTDGSVRLTNATDLSTLPVGPAGSVLHLRFNHTQAVPSSDRVKLPGSFLPADDTRLLTLVSDGERWWAQGAAGGASLTCPVVIYSDDCTIPLAILEPGGTDYTDANQDLLQIASTGVIYNKAHIHPWWDYVGGQTEALYQCGSTANPWKSVESWSVHARFYTTQSLNATLSAATTHNWDPTGGDPKNRRQIYRATPTVAIAEVTGMALSALFSDMILDIINVSSTNTMRLKELNGGSSSVNQFLTGVGDKDVGPNDAARLWYDSVSSKWRVLK